jgi:hypothetical protein
VGFRFQRRIRVLPGIAVNVGATGVSVSVGGRGRTLNFSKRGTYGTVGVPGTGISYRQRLAPPAAGGRPASSRAGLIAVVLAVMFVACVSLLGR